MRGDATASGILAGEGTVQKAVRRNRKQGRPTDFWSLQLPKETKRYVPRLLALASIVRSPHRYGITMPSLADRPYFAETHIGRPIALPKGVASS